MDISYYNNPRLDLISLIPTTARRVLDVGCGTGQLGRFLKMRQECQVDGIELLPEVARQARNYLDIVINDDAMRAIPLLPEGEYDCVVMGDVLEHLIDPEKALAGTARAMKQGATLLVSVPNVAHWSVIYGLLKGIWKYEDAGILDRTHLRFFTRQGIVNLLQDVGFQVEQIQLIVTPLPDLPSSFLDGLRDIGIDVTRFLDEARTYQHIIRAILPKVTVDRWSRQNTGDAYHEPPGGKPLAALVKPFPHGELPAAVTDPPGNSGVAVGGKGERLVDKPPAADRPVVSVVVVSYNSSSTIATCLESVLSTLGPGDEVIVVDNASQDETPYYLQTLAGKDKRLVVRALETNRGYAGGAAEGVRLARNDYVIFLNPDTQVFGPWVYQLLQPMLENADVAASGPVSNYAAGSQNVGLYGDLQRVTGQISIEQIRQNLAAQWQGKFVETKLLIGFCLAVRREALERIGGFDEALYLGNDDLDLSWRLQQAGYKQVVVPSVFVYHQGQVSFNTEPKVRTAYLVQQSTNQLYEKLYMAYSGDVPSGEELWGISWFKPQSELLSIVIPVHKDPEATRQCLESIVRHTHRPYEIIVVDNAADNDTKAALREFSKDLSNVTIIVNDTNLGYPRACNQGMEAASGEYIAVMNNDVIVPPHWASRLLAAFSVDPQIGAVGPRTNYAVGPQRVETASYTIEDLDRWAASWHRAHAGFLRSTSRLIGFLLVLRRQLVNDIGGFDPLFGIGNFEDDDFSLRALLKGYKLVIADDVFVHHHGSRSFGRIPQKYVRLMETNKRLFQSKWAVHFDNQAYNPAEVLNRRGQYRNADIYIPLSFESIFAPSVEPLDVGSKAPCRLLCVPDPSDPLESWLDLFKSYFTAFGEERKDGRLDKAGEGATRDGQEENREPKQGLIIRAEPAEKAWVDRLIDGLRLVSGEMGIDLDKRNDLIVEARNIPSAARGQVYRAATAFIPLPGVRCESLVLEAQACGLQILPGYRPEDLIRAVRREPEISRVRAGLRAAGDGRSMRS